MLQNQLHCDVALKQRIVHKCVVLPNPLQLISARGSFSAGKSFLKVDIQIKSVQ